MPTSRKIKKTDRQTFYTSSSPIEKSKVPLASLERDYSWPNSVPFNGKKFSRPTKKSTFPNFPIHV